VGGVEKRLLYILKKLKESGRYEPHVVCIHSKGPLAPFFEEAGIPVHLIKFNSRFDPRAIFRMVRLLRELGADVVHTHMYRPGVSGAVAARIYGAKLVGNVHNMEHWDNRRQLFVDRLFNPLRDVVVGVSQAVVRDFCRRTSFPHERTKVVYNGVDVSEFECGPKKGNGFLCLCVSRLVPQKRLDRVVELFSRLREKMANLSLFIIGGGPLLDELKEMTEGIADVRFLGERLDVNRYYSAADVLFLLSEKEGFANVILEAMASCVVPVVTDVGGNKEVVEHGKCGFLVEKGVCLSRVFLIPAYLKKLSINARSKVERDFTLENMFRMTDKIYGLLLHARTRAV